MITLAIPNRNGAKYLAQTLASLSSPRNRPEVRWWLQDCCSSDESLSIAERFRSGRDVVRSARDTGQANGLNRAFAEMGGDIIGYINSDDCLVDGAATAVLDAFRRHPDADMVFGGVDWIDENGNVTGHHRGQIYSFEDALNIYEVWWRKKQWVQPEVFFRRSLYEAVGGFDEEFSLAFDFDFWLRMLKLQPKVIEIPDTLVRFRIHPNQRSADFRSANDEIRRAVWRELQDPNSPLEGSLRSRLRRVTSYDLYCSRSSLSSSRDLTLGRALLKSPEWLLLPEVRKRVLGASFRRLHFSSETSN
ncbi:MAG TPA: glycosyltransferase family 2 protein [Bradyrhizobium sp.]|nr:glycosyltransferase family 2 protein [Bradyrhizobium sp.]